MLVPVRCQTTNDALAVRVQHIYTALNTTIAIEGCYVSSQPVNNLFQKKKQTTKQNQNLPIASFKLKLQLSIATNQRTK